MKAWVVGVLAMLMLAGCGSGSEGPSLKDQARTKVSEACGLGPESFTLADKASTNEAIRQNVSLQQNVAPGEVLYLWDYQSFGNHTAVTVERNGKIILLSCAYWG